MKAFWLALTRALPLSALLVAQVVLSLPASATAGGLDPTFGTNGQVLTDLGSASFDAGRGSRFSPTGSSSLRGQAMPLAISTSR